MLSLLLLTVFVQLYIHFRYLFSVLYIPARPSQDQQTLPVSIIVAARNEAHNLPDLIQALCHQTYPLYEVIVVNDRSTDDTFNLLFQKELLHKHLSSIHIDQVLTAVSPKKHALSLGIAKSKYDWLLFIDADCLPASPIWIEKMMQARNAKTEIVLGISPYKTTKGEGRALLNAIVHYETFYTILQYIGFAIGGKPYMGVGRNLLYNKQLFVKSNGFGRFQGVVGGDDDLFVNNIATAMNTAVCLDERGYTYSLPPTTWQSWVRQKTRHLSVGKHYKLVDKFWLGLLHASQGLGWVLCLYNLYNLPALFIWGIRCAIVWIAYSLIIKQLQLKMPKNNIPYFDFIFPLYIFTVGIIATLRKKIKWKN